MARLDARWNNFTQRGQVWDSWWMDGPADAPVEPVEPSLGGPSLGRRPRQLIAALPVDEGEELFAVI